MPAEVQTTYRRGLIALASLALVVASILLFSWILRSSAGFDDGIGRWVTGVVGWGTPLIAIGAAVDAMRAVKAGHHAVGNFANPLSWWFGATIFWLGGWVLIARGMRSELRPDVGASPAAGNEPNPALAKFQDFHWGTATAYGGGILLSEVFLLVLDTLLASRVQLAPTVAFSASIIGAFAIAFGAGFLGASRSRRISVPEAALSLIYFGLPIPLLLASGQSAPRLQNALREVIYLAELLGRPELGYWLTFVILSLALILGITTGFVATGSGRADVRAGIELFIARRHVSVFRPRFLLGVLLVLMFFVVPPLIILGILLATERAVERNRIKLLGVKDPLVGSEALNRLKQNELSPTAMMTSLSVGGVGLGVMSLIIVLSVMSGFEADLKQKILGTNAHAMVLKYGEDFEEYQEVMKKIREVPGIVGESPVILNEVMISSDRNSSGTIVKGIDPATVGDVTDLPKNILEPGNLNFLEHPEKIGVKTEENDVASPDDPIVGRTSDKAVVLPGILLGQYLAGSLRVTIGDRVKLISPVAEELGPNGPTGKLRAFRVAGLFYSGMYEYDSKFAYIPLKEAQSFFNVKGVTGIELKVADIDEARKITRLVLAKLDGYPYRTRDWGEMNRNLFSALRLEKLVMGIILTMLVIVAAGLIVATVVMLVLEKRKEIAVLKALGVSDAGIVKIFLAEGLQIGLAGGLLGLVAGLAACVFIERVGIKLDPQVYYISALPVKIEPLQTAIAVLIAILTTYLASIYPALKASRVEPVEGLKAE